MRTGLGQLYLSIDDTAILEASFRSFIHSQELRLLRRFLCALKQTQQLRKRQDILISDVQEASTPMSDAEAVIDCNLMPLAHAHHELLLLPLVLITTGLPDGFPLPSLIASIRFRNSTLRLSASNFSSGEALLPAKA